MEQNMLVRVLADTHQLHVLGFFIEHPVHQFSVLAISKYLGIARDTVKKDIDYYVGLGYISRVSTHGPYQLKLNDEMVQTLIRSFTEITATNEPNTKAQKSCTPHTNRLYNVMTFIEKLTGAAVAAG